MSDPLLEGKRLDSDTPATFSSENAPNEADLEGRSAEWLLSKGARFCADFQAPKLIPNERLIADLNQRVAPRVRSE